MSDAGIALPEPSEQDSKKTAVDDQDQLDILISTIGLARFVGRINSGLIDERTGYDTVARFMQHAHRRPFLSRLSHAMLGRTDTFEDRE